MKNSGPRLRNIASPSPYENCGQRALRYAASPSCNDRKEALTFPARNLPIHPRRHRPRTASSIHSHLTQLLAPSNPPPLSILRLRSTPKRPPHPLTSRCPALSPPTHRDHPRPHTRSRQASSQLPRRLATQFLPHDHRRAGHVYDENAAGTDPHRSSTVLE